MSKLYCGIYNGLGNQLFGFALGMYLSKKYNRELIIDLSKLNLINFLSRIGLKKDTRREYELNKIGINYPVKNFTYFEIIKGNKFLKGKKFTFADFRDSHKNLDHVIQKQNIYAIGFGEFDFVKEVLPEMRRKFAPNFKITNSIFETIKVINEKNSIAVHIRRTDYLNPKLGGFANGICTDKYYQNAIQLLKESIENPYFIIFSDDTNHVKNNLNFENSYIVNGNAGYEDLYLMSLCKHFILANSTFSYWAAILNASQNKTVCVPKYWYNSPRRQAEFIPEEWTQIAIE